MVSKQKRNPSSVDSPMPDTPPTSVASSNLRFKTKSEKRNITAIRVPSSAQTPIPLLDFEKSCRHYLNHSQKNN